MSLLFTSVTTHGTATPLQTLKMPVRVLVFDSHHNKKFLIIKICSAVKAPRRTINYEKQGRRAAGGYFNKDTESMQFNQSELIKKKTIL